VKNNNDGKIIFETLGGETKVIEPKNRVGRPREFVSPNPSMYALGAPEAQKTEIVTVNQVRPDEKTLIWGIDDALPLHILNAIAESPTATSCVGKIEMFTKGASSKAISRVRSVE